ncbi:MAG: protoporphyrinogen oxidase [Deltaproteobacteria bacterium]|nr:protoporphyrinogen oxidase [Deltaproteobacteria bacterium]MBW2361895.1 protoporphyrinogen oxidase [Deltaproteobacteria bacterium]
MPTADCAAVVVGAGVAGLAAALELEKTTSEVVVLDAADRPGGVMRTDHVAGYVVERGPNSVQLKPPMYAALRDRNLDAALTRALPASRRRWIWRDAALQAVPMSPLGFVRTPLLTPLGKLRLLVEPFVRRRDASNESVAEFATRRFGPQVAQRLVGPFLTGVYAGDERTLGAGAVFGQLVEFERRAGSVVLGAAVAALGRGKPRAPAGSWSAPEGLGPFARRLADRLNEPPALGAQVVALHRDGAAWRLDVSSPAGESQLRAQRVVLAVGAPAAARLLGPLEPRCAELLAGVAYAPVVSLPLGVAADSLVRPADGFGFLVPRDADASLLGCLFMSQLFSGRAPAGHELLHCLLGGMRWPEAIDTPDDQLVERAARDLDRALGLRGAPQPLGVTRWRQAIPQPGRDHVARIAELRARLAGLAGLALAGAYLDGVAVADAFASGLRAAHELATPV